MDSLQVVRILLILIFGMVLGLIMSFAPKRAASLNIFLTFAALSFVCMAFGIGTACLFGNNCADVLALRDPGGFSRAYAGGLSILVATLFYGIKELISKAKDSSK